jgi:hypothetical protein
MDYKINITGKLKTLHANLLKKYSPRDETHCGVLTTCAVSLIDFSEEGTRNEKNSMILPTDTQTENSRLMRWALQLQPYRFRIVAIKGSNNVGADYLSRQ